MSDHSELVIETAMVEKMTTAERLKHAKKQRSRQLKRFANYEKQLEKDKAKKNKHEPHSQQQHQNQQQLQNQHQSPSQHRSVCKQACVKFAPSIMILEAAARNDVDEARKLLMAGVSADVTNEDGITSLHQCCIDDSADMLKLLLEFGANVNVRDKELWTPLHAAATCGHTHLCKTLIEKGAELLAVNADGNMPYDICEDEVCLDLIEAEMAKRGTTQENIDNKRLETERRMLNDLKKLAAEEGDLEVRDKNLATPLHVAAANGYIDVVEFLLKHHVSVNVQDEDGWLPIHAAACWLQPEVIEMLVKHGADIDAKTKNEETAFDLAEDPDVKLKILDLKDELEDHGASQFSGHVRNRRVSTRSASIRRTSLRGDKCPLFKKEAQEEAKHFGVISNDDDDSVTLESTDEESPADHIDEVDMAIIAKKYKEQQQGLDKSNINDEEFNEKRVDKADSEELNEAASLSSKTTEQATEVLTVTEIKETIEIKKASKINIDSRKPSDSCSGENIAQTSSHTNSSHTKDEDQVQWKSGSNINNNNPEPIRTDRTSNTNPESDQPRESSSDAPSAKNQGTTRDATAASFRKKCESQKKHSDKQFLQDLSDKGPVAGTLADLKKHRLEQYKGTGHSAHAHVQDLFLHSLENDGKKYSSGNLQSTQQGDKACVHNGQSSINTNNTSGQSQPPTFLRDNEPLKRFSSSSVIGGDDGKFPNDCCVVV